MKALILTALLCASSQALAVDTYTVKGKTGQSKLQALSALIKDPGARVQRCYDVEITEKATLRKTKKVAKK